MVTTTRPTAVGDQPVYSVTWGKSGTVHGVMGRHCLVTICSLDFVHIAYPYTDAEITCLTCQTRLGELYGDHSH